MVNVVEEDRPVVHAEDDGPVALAINTVTSASVGTALKTGVGTITAFTMNQPTAASVDDSTPLTLVDAAAAPTATSAPPRVIFSASLRALACEYEPRPGVALTPGTTAPTWPKTIVPAGVIPSFVNGCFVQSCPANTTFTITC